MQTATRQTTCELTAWLKAEALRLGFTACGVAPAVTPRGIHRLAAWLEAGYAGEMAYIERRQAAYSHPRSVLEGVRSLLMLAMNYRTAEPVPPRPGQGRVSRYAWGSDYHDLIHAHLRSLADGLRQAWPGALARGVVDTAPLLEREFAQLAGLGWIGKHTLLLSRDAGSWFFLAALLTDLELEYDVPHEADHCGTCRACLDACPTQAFVAPYVLDARRCISYLTIELRGPIPPELRSAVGDWVFGCDVCQEVCPWNRRAPAAQEPRLAPRPDSNPLSLEEILLLDEEGFRARFRHTPLWRARRRGLLRNAAIVLGNTRPPQALALLSRALRDHDPIVRGAAAWALGQLQDPQAQAVLSAHLDSETDEAVRGEIRLALETAGGAGA
jgi:epoxyqueuosine reductase